MVEHVRVEDQPGTVDGNFILVFQLIGRFRRVFWPSKGKNEHLILGIPQFEVCLAIGG